MRIPAEKFVEASDIVPVLDVRSPGEYMKGHIPGAHSFPLFSDTERAEVGTLYKQIGQQEAVARGLELVSPKIRQMVDEAQVLARDGKLLVHCWRGGMRSESVGNLLKIAGIQVQLLEGGYKAYRRWALSQFEKAYDFRIIGGMTGAGKTEVLQALALRGEQMVDLEDLADHRGSAFGRLGAGNRVTQAQFENDLASALYTFKDKRIWIEDESRQIGSLIIPLTIWVQMRKAAFYYLKPGKENRIERLINDYGDFSKELIRDSVDKIKKRLGGLRYRQAVELIEQNERRPLVSMLLDYYDKSYLHGAEERKPKVRYDIDSSSMAMSDLITHILELAEK